MSGSHPEQIPPYNILTNIISTLASNNFTSFATLLGKANATALSAFYSDSTDTPTTIFAPIDSAFAGMNDTTRGYAFQEDDQAFLQALVSYHSVQGNWTLPAEASQPFHTILTTALTDSTFTNLENGEAQVMTVLASSGQFGNVEAHIINQKSPVQILDVPAIITGNVTIRPINAVLGMPGKYSFEESAAGITQFEELHLAAGEPDFGDFKGFTIFAPQGNGQFFKEAQARYPSSQQLKSLFNNHVIYDQTVWSSNFTSGAYASQSGFNYTFSSRPGGGFSLSLNGVTQNITTADILVENGVIHMLDDALWNIGTDVGSSASPEPSTASGIGSRIPSGALAGIVIAAVVVFGLLCTAIFYFWWQRRAHGVKALARRAEDIDGSLTPTALRTSPFQSQIDIMQVTPLPVMYQRSTPAQSSGYSIPIQNPAVLLKEATRPRSEISSDPSYERGSANSPVQLMQGGPLTEEVMEHLLQALAQRIDRGDALPPESVANGSGLLPPEYRPTS